MQKELTCNQVIALMSFYVEDKINNKLKEYVDNHLRNCPKCREIYMQSKKIASHILNLGNTNDETPFQTKQYEDFKNNLSAYIDNELDENDSLRVKKIAISNPLARKDLENMYKLKKIIHNSFDKSKNEWKNDYSKIIVNQISDRSKFDNTLSFNRLLWAFGILISILTVTLVVTLYS